MKKLNENNVYREMLSMSINLKRLDKVYQNGLNGTTGEVLKMFQNFPKAVLKKQTDKALNLKGKELFFQGKLKLKKIEIIDFLEENSIHPKLKNSIINVEYEDEKDDEYDELKMFEEDEKYGIVRHIDYKPSFKNYKKVVAERKLEEEKFERKYGREMKRKVGKKISNSNKPQPKLGK